MVPGTGKVFVSHSQAVCLPVSSPLTSGLVMTRTRKTEGSQEGVKHFSVRDRYSVPFIFNWSYDLPFCLLPRKQMGISGRKWAKGL